jgi:hypothetical protein
MTTKPFLLLTLILTLAFASCNKATPAGFWKNYQKKFLVKNISDQGPYGGHRAIYWKVDKPNSFISSSVLDFAIKNGWTLVDSSEFNQEQTYKWTYTNNPIFPLSHKGFTGIATNNSVYQYFPRWFDGQIKVYKFKTGWVAIEPGTDSSIEENGFVLINKINNEIAVYHLWGE